MVEREQERLGLNPSNAFVETLSLNGEVIFEKKLTLRELFRLKKYEGKEWNIVTDIPFFFEVRDLGDSFLNIASFPEGQPIDGQGFFYLLKRAKSGGSFRMGQDLPEISSDWDIIFPEVRAKDPRKKALYNHHKENVPYFSEFEKNHFKKFWHTINPSPESIDMFFHKLVRRFISEEALISYYGKEFFTSSPENLIRMTTWYEYRALTIEFLRIKGYDLDNLKSETGKCYEKLVSLFSSFNKLRSVKVQREWYDYLVSRKGERQMAIDACKDVYYHWYGGEPIVVDKNGDLYDTRMISGSPSKYNLRKSVLNGAGSIEKFGSGQVKVSKGECYIIIDFVTDEKEIRKPVIQKRRYGPNAPSYLSPLIIWKRDKETSKASYFCGQIPQEFMQSHPHLFSERHDTLLGQLVVSAYSPEVRDQMAKEIKMRGTDGREVTQQLLEAQSVLLVPMHAQRFLKQSPVILDLEKLRSVDRASLFCL